MKYLWPSLIIFIHPSVNDFPQDSHLKSLQPSWTVLNHLLIWPAQVNIFFTMITIESFVKVIGVNLVVIYFLKKELWRNTFTQFLNSAKITNVNLVENHLHFCLTWEVISKPWNVALLKNQLLSLLLLGFISKQFMILITERENNHEDQKDFKCDTCAKLFSHPHHLRVHIKTIFECQKDFKCDSFLNSKY